MPLSEQEQLPGLRVPLNLEHVSVDPGSRVRARSEPAI